MTDTKTQSPSDAELVAFAIAEQFLLFCDSDEFVDIARAVLAKWGQPQAVAGGEPVAEMVPCHTPSGKRVAVISRFQHLPIGTKLYTHPQPAAQDAERKPLSKEQRAEIMEEVDSYNFPEDLIDATEKAHGIKGGQHEI